MASVSDIEIARQYGVLKQSLSIHSSLRDEYTGKAKATEIILLVSSLVFGVTTFAGDDFFSFFGVSSANGKVILGIASLAALASSLVVLVIDWKGQAALHKEAAGRFHEVLQEFRTCQTGKDSWPPDQRPRLATAYRDLHKNTVDIPNRRFDGLKSRYRRQVATNRLKDRYPGCPRLLLSLHVRMRDTKQARSDLCTGALKRDESDES